MRRTVWSEFVPFENLGRRTTLSALAQRDIGLFVAVTPGGMGGLSTLVRRARDHGVWIGVWPMVGDGLGRYAAGRNRELFMRHTSRVLGTLLHDHAVPDGLALDLEPPLEVLRRAAKVDPRTWTRWMWRQDSRQQGYEALLEAATGIGVETLAATIPALLADGRGRGFERVLDTPLPNRHTDRMCPMAYSSLFEGYSAGRLSRTDAVALVALTARVTSRRFGRRGSLALGIVGRGALGDEASYRSVNELRDDVSVARAEGVDDLLLHDLAGILARPPAESWLDAFVDTDPKPARLTVRARAVGVSAWALSRVLGLPGRMHPR